MKLVSGDRSETSRSAIFGLVLLFIGVQLGAQAQTTQADRAQLTQSQNATPEGAAGDYTLPTTPNDPDLGEPQVLKRTESYQPWTFSLATPIFYTSNVALTNSGELHDVITAPVAAIFYQPRLANNLYGLVDVRQQLFYYGRHHDFDFGSMDVEAGISYVIPQWHNLMLHGEYDFNRLTDSDRVLDEFFTNHSIILSAEMPFRIDRAQQLSLGADTNLSVAADHQSPRRNDYEGYAVYSIFLTRSFSLNGVGRVVVHDYHQNDRTDVSEVISATANLQLTKWWAVSAMTSFAHNDSNHSVFDYNVVDAGASMALTTTF
ncbi:MAG TPA: hypothetical protein VEI58_05680 [Chthoniobacterales bacterium]|nr:hypothetical protein [Chthoniobacterales bacterium]